MSLKPIKGEKEIAVLLARFLGNEESYFSLGAAKASRQII